VTKLVIVESPAKARTIGGYLGAGYAVEASIGHIRDLPQPSELPADMKKGPFGKFSVDVDNGFEPYYVVDSDKKKIVAELRRLLKSSDELLLATDEQRFQALWRAYFRSLTIRERLNPRKQRQDMPVRFWPHLTEMQPEDL